MSSRPTLSVGGENLIDHVTRDGEVSANAGGSPFNVALAMGRQGAEVRYLSPISTDHWGETLAATLTASGVDLTGGRVDLPTTLARVTVEDGIPSYAFERTGTAERAVSADGLAAQISGIDALHTGSLAVIDDPDGQVWEDAVASVFASGRFVSLDPNVRLSMVSDMTSYRARMLRLFKTTHLLKLSDEDLDGLFPEVGEANAMAHILDSTSACMVVLTRGPEGSSAWVGDERVDVPAPPVPDLVDTVGAGDTFMATLIATLAENNLLASDRLTRVTVDETRNLLERAATAAALNCAREGCDPPTHAELEAALAP